MTRRFLLGALFVLPVIILLPHLAQFPLQPGGQFSDLLISHYPNGLFIQETIREWGTIPLWSPLILSGYPFAANPLSGLYYLPGWLALLFPLPFGFNLVAALHLVWGGVGMYRFLRSEGLCEPAALLGGLTFAALPKLYAHLAAGHLTLLYAVPWTPWLLLAERKAIHSELADADRRSGLCWNWLYSGAVLGMIALADVRWLAYAGLLWIAYGLASQGIPSRQLGRSSFPRWVLARLASVLFAVTAAAALLLPMVEYLQLSTRSQLTAHESFTLSMPPGQLFGLIYPTLGSSAEWTLYPGAVTLALALYVLSLGPLRRKTSFWLWLVLLTLVFSLGSYIPFLELAGALPGFGLLRVPPRMLFLCGFGFAVLAGFALHDLLERRVTSPSGARDRSGLVLFAAAAFAVLLAAAVWLMVRQPLTRIQFAWGALFLAAGAALVMLAGRGKLRPAALVALVVSASLVDLLGVNGLSITFRDRDEVLDQAGDIADFLEQASEQRPFRVYSPSYSLPQHVAAWRGLELADGVDPLQIAAYVDYMEGASGVQTNGYSVTLPPFENGDPAADNQGAVPDAEKLGLINVRYIVSEYDFPGTQLPLRAQFGQTRVYENPYVLPRAWVQQAGSHPGKDILSEPILDKQPNRVSLKAQGPGLLVLSEITYPGWQASVDGQPARLELVGDLLRGVRLSEGDHQVEIVFRPLLVYAGWVFSALAWIMLVAYAIKGARHG